MPRAAGYDHLIAYDHVLGVDPNRPARGTGAYTNEALFHEPFVLFGFLAAATTRIECWTGVLILPQRPTALVAKQAAEVAVLSGGRLVLGVGVGWNPVEYEALGQDFRTRGRRLEEQVGLLRALWTNDTLTFEGEFDRVTAAGINPLPGHEIPIWMGGQADRVLDRIGRLGDGWLVAPALRNDPGGITPYVERIHEAARTAGRDPATIGLESRVSIAGLSVAQQVELAHEWEALGCTHVTLNTMGAGLETPAAHLEAVRAFAAAVGRS
ncbi:MAG: LLM class F420-dependent oxidoreductase [Chloroflexi bacterium]|nr:LLM class F420-dependent oxidoreductase [Chloroflexota bacterium]